MSKNGKYSVNSRETRVTTSPTDQGYGVLLKLNHTLIYLPLVTRCGTTERSVEQPVARTFRFGRDRPGTAEWGIVGDVGLGSAAVGVLVL